jgi:hypothetical protein
LRCAAQPKKEGATPFFLLPLEFLKNYEINRTFFKNVISLFLTVDKNGMKGDEVVVGFD